VTNIIAQKLDRVYRDYRAEIITSEIAIKNIVDLLEALNYATGREFDKKRIGELIKKGVRLILRIDVSSKQTYKFLVNCVTNSTLDLSARYEIYSVLERNFPKKVNGLGRYLLEVGSGYFPDNIDDNGELIIKFGLSDFLFKTYKILSEHDKFRFNINYNGFVSKNCLIVAVKFDSYNNEIFDAKFFYSQREKWKITGYGKSLYIIDDKHNIGIRDLIFAVNLFKRYIYDFDDEKLSIQYSNDTEIPIQVDYKDSDIKIYFFESPIIKHDAKPQPETNKIKKRAEVIDFGYFEN